jgi:hypothetical protein
VSLVEGPTAQVDPNPLKLPSRKVTLDPGKRVFTVSDQMLANAKPGSTLVLYSATALGFDGDDVIIEGRGGPQYKVHGAYVLPVPDEPKVRVGDAVITEWNHVMKHAVVTKLLKDRVVVRYTDMDGKAPEAQLKGARFIRQTEGLKEGNYAALRDGEVMRHVLLVSSYVVGGTKMWFALGFGGAAMTVEESALRPIPVRHRAKVGATVLAENVGLMRRATVTALDDPGRFTVKFDRAGRPAVVGWGMLMSSDEPGRDAKKGKN